MIYLYYIICFWLFSVIFWFPFWTITVEVLIENNYPEYSDNKQVITIITLFVSLLLSPLGWIMFTKILYKFIIRKDKKQTIKMIIAETFKENE